MAKLLWLLRHFEAVDNPPPGRRDRDRRLSLRGEAEAEALGVAIEAGEVDAALPALILSSPAARTRATSEAVFGRVSSPSSLATDARLYRATPDDVIEILRELPDELEAVALVGHNPTLHCLSLDLVAEQPDGGLRASSTRSPPGSLAIIELPVASWAELGWAEGRLCVLRIPRR